jgi:hypothetical protein
MNNLNSEYNGRRECMNIVKTPVRTFHEQAYCNCGGTMKPDESVRGDKFPYEYGHVCDRCGYKEYSKDIFPRIGYEFERDRHL